MLGDALQRLRSLPTASVDTVITSPPYFRLRNYGEDDQLGLEGTVTEFVDRLVAICEEAGRVLKPSGGLWLNLGDSYSTHDRYGAAPKSLLMVPERVALALTASGFTLRSKIIWSKPNPMPTSVTDRFTCSYEVIYFLVRSRSYFFDLDAIREPHKSRRKGLTTAPASTTPKVGPTKYGGPNRDWAGPLTGDNSGLAKARAEGRAGHPLGRTPHDVWTIPTGGFRGAHFATFPERLLTRPILAGCPARTCAACGAPWHQSSGIPTAPSCGCGTASFERGLILDPFMGSGTTALAAQRHGRDWLGIELNPEYRTLAIDRIAGAPRRAEPDPLADAA
jgi:DNA modification methylase